jgi:hypothetical protein
MESRMLQKIAIKYYKTKNYVAPDAEIEMFYMI